MNDLHRSTETRRRGFAIAACLIGALALTAAGCGGAADSARAELPVPKVTVAEVVQQETIDFDEFVGRTEASETVEVRPRVFGYLKTVEFKDGDYVNVDQPLFLIEPDQYDAVYRQSLSKIAMWEAKLELAKSKLARNEGLVKKGAVSVEDYEETVAAVHEAEANVLAARADAEVSALDLKYTVIKAPIAGRVDRAYVTPGNLLFGATSATLLTRIVKIEPIYVYFDVDERSLLRYQKMASGGADGSSQKAIRDRSIPCYLQLADEAESSREGQLDFAENRIDPTTGTIKIRAVFANKDRTLTPGLFVRVRVPVSEKYEALLIPERAIATDQGMKYVYVVDSSGKAVRRPITLGSSRGSLRIVSSGLKLGEKIIVKGLQRVRPNQQVESTLEEPLAKAASAPGTEAHADSAGAHPH